MFVCLDDLSVWKVSARNPFVMCGQKNLIITVSHLLLDPYDWGPLSAIRFVHYPIKSKVITKLFHQGFSYYRSKQVNQATYWVCDRTKQSNCRARITIFEDQRVYKVTNSYHTHDPMYTKLCF